MAQKVNIILVDDLDGSEATETIAFGLDGTNYEIDLNDDNAKALREAVEKFTGYARKVTGNKAGKSSRRTTAAPSEDKSAVREWAKANGMEVSERGRIPADVQEAYDNRDKASAPTASGRGGKRRSAEVNAEGKVEAK